MVSITWTHLYPEPQRTKTLRRLKTKAERSLRYKEMREQVEEFSHIVFVFLLYNFFQKGTEVTNLALNTFGELGEKGFNIGTTYFEKGNENALRGEVLASKLLESLRVPELVDIVKNSSHIHEIIDRYKTLKNAE